jgi:hypothetical protein
MLSANRLSMVALCHETLAKLWNKLDRFQSATACGDRLVDVLHVGVQTAEIAFAFGGTLQ